MLLRECAHFIRMIIAAVPALSEESKPLETEAKELNLIFNAINNKLK